VDCTNEVARSLSDIRAASEQTVLKVSEVADTIQEQSMATQTMAQNIEKIASMTEDNHGSVAKVSQLARGLATLAGGLNQQIGKFKV